MKKLAILLLFGISQPALAQHSGHDMPMPAKPAEKPKPKAQPVPVKKPAPQAKKPAAKPVAKPKLETQPAPPMDHSQMDHSEMDAASMENMPEDGNAEAMDHSAMDHSSMNMSEDSMEGMDHGDMDSMSMDGDAAEPDQMDHSTMDHGSMDMSMPMADEPPPPAAGSGPANAADAIWGAEAMNASRKQLAKENGGQKISWIMADRAEYRLREGKDGYLWDGQGYYGGDINKFWFKTEGEGSFGEKIESAEVQALYSRAIAPFFDFQAGIRQDFAPLDRTYAVVGIQGLAPYFFEVDGAAFLSDRGDFTARFEAEYDQRITQRLILQPRLEINLAAQDVPELGIGAGLDAIEAGLRLRYQIAREFAPYIGIEQEWKIGQSADYARADGEDPSVTNYVVGIRFWF